MDPVEVHSTRRARTTARHREDRSHPWATDALRGLLGAPVGLLEDSVPLVAASRSALSR